MSGATPPADAVLETAFDRIAVTDVVVTVGPRPGRRARRRSLVAEPTTWPAPRTSARLVRTTGTGQWRAVLAYEGQSVEVVLRARDLDATVAFAEAHLAGMENTVAEAEAERLARREHQD